jgi:hypothetical protein
MAAIVEGDLFLQRGGRQFFTSQVRVNLLKKSQTPLQIKQIMAQGNDFN